MADICNTCQKTITNSEGSVKFKCPECGKATIIRCKHCRQIASKFVCPNCGFTGPN